MPGAAKHCLCRCLESNGGVLIVPAAGCSKICHMGMMGLSEELGDEKIDRLAQHLLGVAAKGQRCAGTKGLNSLFVIECDSGVGLNVHACIAPLGFHTHDLLGRPALADFLRQNATTHDLSAIEPWHEIHPQFPSFPVPAKDRFHG